MWVSSDRQPAASVYIHTLNLQLLAVLALEGKYKSRLRRTPKVFFFFFLIHQNFVCFIISQQLLKPGSNCSRHKTYMELAHNSVI